MYVITVEFEIAQKRIAEFCNAVRENAALSLRDEPECHQFDVCVDETKPERVFLYEVYTDHAAFDEHLKSAHFLTFNELVSPWVVSKQVRAYERVHP